MIIERKREGGGREKEREKRAGKNYIADLVIICIND